MPPLPTNSLPASNCGLARMTASRLQPSGTFTPAENAAVITAGKISEAAMKETSTVKNPIPGGSMLVVR